MMTPLIIIGLFVLGIAIVMAAILHDVEPLALIAMFPLVISVLMSLAAPISTREIKAQNVTYASTPSEMIVEADGIIGHYTTLSQMNEIKNAKAVYISIPKNFWGVETSPSIIFKKE